MNNLKFIFYVFFVSFCFSNENPFINVEPDYKVEVGIKSIVQADNDEYIISVYAINPYNPIAGVQFKIIPDDIFEVLDVYGGRAEEKDFETHFNKKGTILGFSMVANTIDPSIIVAGPARLESNILLEIKVKSNILDGYDLNSELNFECVFASKKGEVLETKFIPFNLSDITRK
tara:strand:+ start:344 stop:865 length:522 start_codon:yes stop_codon:yes gene_type:complete